MLVNTDGLSLIEPIHRKLTKGVVLSSDVSFKIEASLPNIQERSETCCLAILLIYIFVMTRRFSDWDLDCKVYIGSISTRTTKDDIESLFSKYGPLRNVWIARNPPGFAFVEYEDRRDAEEAVAELDGVRLCGQRIRVEMSHGKTRRDRRSDTRRSPPQLIHQLLHKAASLISNFQRNYILPSNILIKIWPFRTTHSSHCASDVNSNSYINR
ncbi:RNA-binding protein 1 [Caerostris extrusa]|uniref:RNA-binding protein 1 n=1 Tax=Caerostris extrusa TaxID=172846 RepID=A0AAV4RZL9_CAEEX|nr:RNA-binding protein 1 [Caerostris extrusa]